MNATDNKARLDYYSSNLIHAHEALMGHELTEKWLSGENIRMEGKLLPVDGSVDLTFESGPLSLTTIEFAHLFSIFNASRVVTQMKGRGFSPAAPDGMYVTVVNNHLLESPQKNRTGLVQLEDVGLGLAIPSLFLDNIMLKSGAPKYLGTVSFGLCAIQAFVKGLDSISLVAAGGVGFDKRYFGYKVWPKLGFDADLDPGEFHQDNAPELVGCRTVLEAIAASEESWALHGSQRRMTFDLQPHSTSWDKLLEYFRAKGIWSAL